MTKATFLDKLAQRVHRIGKEEIFHVLHDVADEKRVLESALEFLADGVVVLDPDGRVLFANRTAMTLLEVRSKQPRGLALQTLVKDTALAALFCADRGEIAQSLHREIQTYSPRPMLLSADFVPLRGDKGEVAGTAILLKDISEKRRMEGRMAQSERLGALSLLAAGLAHEIGNPLNSITIHLQLIAREIKKLKGAGKVRELHATVQEEIKRLDEIVHRFLAAIRPLKPRYEEIQINAIIRDVLRLLKPELTRQRVRCDMRLEGRLEPTLVDMAQIKQALINLIKNAMQAMPKGGVLVIATGMQDNTIRIRIQDSGKGIAPENLSKIFDPYFTTRENGSGLGLMMTYRIIKEHGGDIEVKSEPGTGTEFLLLLPLRSVHPKMLEATRRET